MLVFDITKRKTFETLDSFRNEVLIQVNVNVLFRFRQQWPLLIKSFANPFKCS